MEAGELDTNYFGEETMTVGDEENITRYQCELIRNGMTDKLNSIEGQFEVIERQLEAMWKKIDGRPSWAVLIIITGQSSLIVGLIVGILMVLLRK